MNVFLRIDINLAAMIMLSIVCLISSRRLDMKDQLNKVFLISSAIIILELFFETATCILNSKLMPWIVPISTFLHLCLFSGAPMLTYFWYRMISHWVVPEEKISRKKHVILLIPVAVNLIVVLLSPLYG